MANKELQGNKYDIPKELLVKLKNILLSFNGGKNVRGISRLENLVSKGSVTYEQLKRIKNFFDNSTPDEDITEYRLNGGESMKKWVDEILNGEREKIHHGKDIRKDQGEKNMHRKAHTNSKPLDRDYLMDKLSIDESFIKNIQRINNKLK